MIGISSYGPGTELETLVCFCGWVILVWRNAINRLYIFSFACLFSAAAYAVAIWQYYIIFWVHPKSQDDFAMLLLFVRMLFHVICVMIFNAFYKSMPNLKRR